MNNLLSEEFFHYKRMKNNSLINKAIGHFKKGEKKCYSMVTLHPGKRKLVAPDTELVSFDLGHQCDMFIAHKVNGNVKKAELTVGLEVISTTIPCEDGYIHFFHTSKGKYPKKFFLSACELQTVRILLYTTPDSKVSITCYFFYLCEEIRSKLPDKIVQRVKVGMDIIGKIIYERKLLTYGHGICCLSDDISKGDPGRPFHKPEPKSLLSCDTIEKLNVRCQLLTAMLDIAFDKISALENKLYDVEKLVHDAHNVEVPVLIGVESEDN